MFFVPFSVCDSDLCLPLRSRGFGRPWVDISERSVRGECPGVSAAARREEESNSSSGTADQKTGRTRPPVHVRGTEPADMLPDHRVYHSVTEKSSLRSNAINLHETSVALNSSCQAVVRLIDSQSERIQLSGRFAVVSDTCRGCSEQTSAGEMFCLRRQLQGKN